MASIAIVGGGRMGEALLGGLLATAHAQPADVAVAEPVQARREELSARYRVQCVERAEDIVAEAEIVIVAVKPQVIEPILRAFGPTLSAGTLVVSIAAGITTARLRAGLPDSVGVVRVMPNTPAMVGAGMSVVSGAANVSSDDVERVRALMEAVGEAVVLPEELQDVATAVSGSGPAYVAVFAEALVRSGVRHGLPYDVASKLVIQTLAGTAKLLGESGQHPEQLADAVSSPGGTTAAALAALEAGNFRAAVAGAVDAAAARSKQLGGTS